MYNSTSLHGKLVIKAVEAKLLIDTEVFGKMDPFLQLDFEGKTLKTPVHTDGGKLPVWNYSFPDVLVAKEGISLDKAMLKFSCFEEDLNSNDFLGAAYIALSKAMQ